MMPTVERVPDGSVVLRFDFDDGVNVQLKYLRGRWDPDRKAWVVGRTMERQAIDILTKRFGDVMVLAYLDQPAYVLDKYGVATEQTSLF